jgi:hypothetical protein
VFHESLKEFWKKSHLENMRASFLRRCQNSLRQTSPKIMYFQTRKINILANIVLLLLIQLRFRKTKYIPQNDRLNLSFVKDFYLVGKKMTRNGHKTAIYESFLTKLKKKLNWKN